MSYAVLFATAATNVAAALAAVQSGGARPDGPFADAPLPFEALKAEPAGAFEVLMLVVALGLLGVIATLAFLALAKLGAVERAVESSSAKLRGELEAWRAEARSSASPADGAAFEAALLPVREALDGLCSRVDAAVERLAAASDRATPAAPGSGGAVAADLDGLVQELRALTGALEASRLSPDGGAGTGGSGDADGAAALSVLREGFAELRDALGRMNTDDGAPRSSASAAGGFSILERVHARLAALGYEGVAIVTESDAITPALVERGEIVVEARRAGAVHKGRVLFEGGVITDVQLRPSHQIFP